MKKLLLLVSVGALVFYLLKDRFGGEPDEFVFTEAPVTAHAEDSPSDQPAA